jgi:hypothetical protein
VGHRRIRAGAAALIVLAGCGGSDQSEKPASRPSATVPKTGGPATAPAALKANGFVVVPRTNVALRPPDGFVVVPSLPGLGRTGTRSTFLVTQGRSPYDDPNDVVDEVASGYNDEAATARHGFEFESVERFSVDGRPAVGAVGTQTAEGRTFNKAIVVFPSEGFFVTLSATLETGDPLSAAEALAVLREARWSTRPGRGSLGFAITPAAGYTKQPSSAGLSYTFKGRLGQGVPLFLVNPSLGESPPAPADRRGAARARFSALPGNPAPESEHRVTIAGLPGWEFTGSGREDGREARIYVVELFTDEGDLGLVGSFDPARFRDQTEAFRLMARSLELTNDA